MPNAVDVTFHGQGFAGFGETEFGDFIGGGGVEHRLVEARVGGDGGGGFADEKDDDGKRGESGDDEEEGFEFHRDGRKSG